MSTGIGGPGWLNELGCWNALQLIEAYHKYDVGSRPALLDLQVLVHSVPIKLTLQTSIIDILLVRADSTLRVQVG
jgi:hypothetical protein